MIPIQPQNPRRLWNTCWFSFIHGSKERLLDNSRLRYLCNKNILKKVFSLSLNGTSIYQNERGMVTAVALLLIAVLTLLGTGAIVVTSTDILIGGNYKVSEVAFYAAEAGVEEARARLRSSAGANQINDNLYETDTAWRAYIGTLAMAQKYNDNERCQGCLRFESGEPKHSRTNSLQSAISYVVEINHKTDAAGNIMYWGDHNSDGVVTRNTAAGNINNRNIYLVTSSGYTGNSDRTNSFRTVEAEIAKMPPISVPSPLYLKAPNSRIQGSSTYITGEDKCGDKDTNAVTTTNDPGSIDIQGNPTITNAVGTNPSILYNGPNLDITAMVNSLKSQANFSYDVTSATQTGMHWGTPTPGATQEDPSYCSDHNVVYYNTHDTYIKLAGGSSGCGILLVDGDLEVNGGFAWNGIIIVTGSTKYTGGGNEAKQVTGGLLSGGTLDADVVGGNTHIVYCSSTVENQTNSMPLRSLSWRDLRAGN
jgi:Tfp pilus assembly protein PilX